MVKPSFAELVVQWGSILISLGILWFTARKQPIVELLLSFFLTAFISSFVGVVVVENNYLDYPVRLMPSYFKSSLLFEYLAFPALSVLYYRTSRHSRLSGILGQAVLYSSIVTIAEALLEINTRLVKYHTWSWIHSLLSMISVLLFVRLVLKAVQSRNRESEQ